MLRYELQTVERREIRIHYPAGRGRMVLRTELDWNHDQEPIACSGDGNVSTFVLETKRPFVYFKPCLQTHQGLRWAAGANALALMTNPEPAEVYPHFDERSTGTFSDVLERDSTILGRKHMVRVYAPPGYHENTLRQYPVFYMQDGKNLFFPAEAFLGHDWGVAGAVELLDSMSAVDQMLIVGVYSGDRMTEYTKPGYEAYARSIVEEIKPEVDRRMRVLGGPRETGVIGSSLGGVASFYMAWQYPEVFGYAACMSSTFSYRDDLIDRVLSEPARSSKFYLDSGWPSDNYEVTLAMVMALVHRGYKLREDVVHLVFPHDKHEEQAWGSRLHLPIQLGVGAVATSLRRHAPR